MSAGSSFSIFRLFSVKRSVKIKMVFCQAEHRRAKVTAACTLLHSKVNFVSMAKNPNTARPRSAWNLFRWLGFRCSN